MDARDIFNAIDDRLRHVKNMGQFSIRAHGNYLQMLIIK